MKNHWVEKHTEKNIEKNIEKRFTRIEDLSIGCYYAHQCVMDEEPNWECDKTGIEKRAHLQKSHIVPGTVVLTYATDFVLTDNGEGAIMYGECGIFFINYETGCVHVNQSFQKKFLVSYEYDCDKHHLEEE